MVQYDEAKSGQSHPLETAWWKQPSAPNASTQSRMDESVNPAASGHFSGGETAVIKVGDIVSRNDGRSGRVTGFAPNGAARVCFDNGKRRIWRLSTLAARDIDLAELRQAEHERQLDLQLDRDMEAWFATMKPERAATLRDAFNEGKARRTV